MAWTSVGGKILLVETSYSIGKGKIEVTGHLGEIMKESVRTAIGWIKANMNNIGLGFKKTEEILNSHGLNLQNYSKNIFDYIDLNIHFPAAAIQKDGPSAGITIATALV